MMNEYDKEGDAKYLVDGKYYTAGEVKQVFHPEKPHFDQRQRVCLGWVEGKNVLDVGCYSGAFVNAVHHKFPDANVLGVDYFADHIAISKILYPELSECFMRMSAYGLDFPEHFFDCVSLQEVIEHLEEPVKAIREINRVLKTGGVLILSTNNALYFGNVIGALCKSIKRLIGKKVTLSPVICFDNVEWNRHIFCWTPEGLYTLLKTNGFELLDWRIVGSSGRVDKLLLKFLPDFCSTIILKVQKASKSPGRYI